MNTRETQLASHNARCKLTEILDQLRELPTHILGELKAEVQLEIEARLQAAGVKGELTEDEWALIASHNLLSCLNSIRERTGLSLLDAKNYMDRARARGR